MTAAGSPLPAAHEARGLSTDRTGRATRELDTVVGQLSIDGRDDVIASVLADSGVWEPAETAYLQSVLEPGHTFLDVGAHVGYFTLLASRLVGSQGTVVAVEPDARNLELLRRNLARHGTTNVRVLPIAAGARHCWMSMVRNEGNTGAHRLVPLGEGGPRVRVCRLDDLVSEHVDVVKIDAQGYDHDVVEGLSRTIDANPGIRILTEIDRHELGRRAIPVEHAVRGYRVAGFGIEVLDHLGRLLPASVAEVVEVVRRRGHEVTSIVLSPGGGRSAPPWPPSP